MIRISTGKYCKIARIVGVSFKLNEGSQHVATFIEVVYHWIESLMEKMGS